MAARSADGPVHEPVETVDSRARSTVLLHPIPAGRSAPCQHEGMDDTDVPQASIGDVPVDFDETVVLLDVREDDEWQRGHAPGAQHIPMGDVPARLAEIDTEAQLFVVCHAGGRSQRVAQYLARNGYDPVNVAGGMLAWASAGRPLVTDGGATGVV